MPSRLRWLAEFVVYAAALFLVRDPLLQGYAALVQFAARLLATTAVLPPEVPTFLRDTSLTLLTFVALMLATPLAAAVRARAILVGVAVFLLADVLSVVVLARAGAATGLNEDSVLGELYQCVKWLLPFLLWIIATHRRFGDAFGLLAPRAVESEETERR